jgi:AAA+ superfamily predicted ATPase
MHPVPCAEPCQRALQFLKEPKQYGALMTRPPKGVLLEGGPGNGKTLIAKAVAGEAGVPFYQVRAADVLYYAAQHAGCESATHASAPPSAAFTIAQ